VGEEAAVGGNEDGTSVGEEDGMGFPVGNGGYLEASEISVGVFLVVAVDI